MTRPTDARLREIASGALAVRSPLTLTYAEQQAVCGEVLAARALLREVHLRASSGTGYIPAELENRLRAALNKEANDGS